MRSHQHIAVTMAVLLIASVVALPGAVTAAEPAVNDADLDIDVSQNETVTVTVTENGTTVDEMNLTVEPADENATYAGAGTYTNVPGEYELDAPDGNESIEVEFVATVGNATAETTAVIDGVEDDEADGIFGSLVSQFVAENKHEIEGPLGHAVSSFVVENNPGNAPDHAGPPEHAGPGNDDEEKGNQGPPAHAGPGDDTAADDEDDADDAEDAEDGEDDSNEQDAETTDDDKSNGGGPPSHAGPNGNN